MFVLLLSGKNFLFFFSFFFFPFSFQNRKKKRHGASKGELGAAGNVVIRRRTRRVLLMRARASSHLVAPPPWTFSPCLAVDFLPSLCLYHIESMNTLLIVNFKKGVANIDENLFLLKSI